MSDIRYDPLHDEYALIAPERLHRPDRFGGIRESPGASHPGPCPFCPGHEAMTPHEIYAMRPQGGPDSPGWLTRVIPNLYKAVQIEAPWQNHPDGCYHHWDGLGAHEIIVDTPRHLIRMDDWSEEEYRHWLTTLRIRVTDLRNDIRLLYIALFKNHGPRAAATQPHPHTQLIALPVVPRHKLDHYRRAKAWYETNRVSLFASVLEKELEQRRRIVAESGRFVAFAPYASAFAFEVAVLAREPWASIVDLDDGAIGELSTLLKGVVDALYRELGVFDFNLFFNTPPLQKAAQTEAFFDTIPRMWRFGIRIVPRLFGLGGFEIGSGLFINPVPPEEAAELLRGRGGDA